MCLPENAAASAGFEREIEMEESAAVGPASLLSCSSTFDIGRPARASSLPATRSSLSTETVQKALHSLQAKVLVYHIHVRTLV